MITAIIVNRKKMIPNIKKAVIPISTILRVRCSTKCRITYVNNRNYTCRIASGEWDVFLLMGIVEKEDISLEKLANTFLEHCFETNEHGKKLIAYSKLAKEYNIDSLSYPVNKRILPLFNSPKKYVLAESYTVNSLKDLIFLEMLYAVEQNIYISKCKNCGKYYASANAGADYCDRIFRDDKTCKWVGARKTYVSNLKSDDALVLYEKIYQSLQYKKRKADTKIKEKDIFSALTMLRKHRENYKKGKISAEEFINIIKNVSDFK